jgi:hypothetical protein
MNGGNMALRDVLGALNEAGSTERAAERALAGEGFEVSQTGLRATDDVFDAPMMIMNQIHEA